MLMLTGLLYWLWQYSFCIMLIPVLVRLEISIKNERGEVLKALNLGKVAAGKEQEALNQKNISLEQALEKAKDAEQHWFKETTRVEQEVETNQREIGKLKKELLAAKCQNQHKDAKDLAKEIEDHEGWKPDCDMERKIVMFKGTLLFIARWSRDIVSCKETT